jgi:DNA-binding transcriptional ArsR family regulator
MIGVSMSSPLYHPGRREIELPAVLHALSDPQRLHIVRLLADQEQAVPCGSLKLEITKSTATHHFRVLREAGVIEQFPNGTSRLTSLRRADLDARLPGLLDAVLAAGDGAGAAQVGAKGGKIVVDHRERDQESETWRP